MSELYETWRIMHDNDEWRDSLTPAELDAVEKWDDLYDMWENERDDDEWRDDLTPDELEIVERWDDQFEHGIARMIYDSMQKIAGGNTDGNENGSNSNPHHPGNP